MSKYYANKFTITDSGKSPITATLVFQEIDMQILTNAIKMGDSNGQDFELSVGDIVNYKPAGGIDLNQIFFKNASAGSTGYVVVSGVLA